MQTVKEPILEVRKSFPVSKEQLYKAWISRDKLSQWWHPLNSTLQDLELDLRPGGNIRYSFKNNNSNTSFQITGSFEEVDENNCLVYDWNWEMPESLEGGKFKLKVYFQDAPEGSNICIEQEDLSSEESIYPHKDGWEKGLNDLYNYLTKTGSENPSMDTNSRMTGYNELDEQQKVGE